MTICKDCDHSPNSNHCFICGKQITDANKPAPYAGSELGGAPGSAPTVRGWYWWRPSPSNLWECVLADQKSFIRTGYQQKFDTCEGEWGARIKEPENYWCAYCGIWGDHQSGWCPNLEKEQND